MQEPASIGLNPREEKDDGDCKPMCGGAADSTGVACPGTLAKRGTSSGAAGFVVELINGASEGEGGEGRGSAAPEEGLCGEMEEGERQGEIDMESGIGAP